MIAMTSGYRPQQPGARRPARRRTDRRAITVAIAVATGVHALLLWSVRIPLPPQSPPSSPLVLVPQLAPSLELPAARDFLQPTAPGIEPQPDRPVPTRAPATDEEPPRIASPSISPTAPITRTIPPTTLNAFRGAVQPLEAGPEGIHRQTLPLDPKRVATMRAESLLSARLAELPGVKAEPPTGPVSLSSGGVKVAVPWQGFLPADRRDAIWRAERCREGGRGDGDKPGEAEARRAQCD